MTDLVIESTGEVVTEMTTIEAERVTSQIAHHLDRIADSMELVMPLIGEALTRGAWRVLGYASPTAYTSERFSGALTRLALPVRRELVAELSAAGMSTRAIAPIIDKSQWQVRQDRDAGEREPLTSPTPEPVADPPRGEWTSATAALADLADDDMDDEDEELELVPQDEPTDEPEPETTRHGLPVADTVIGLDGKSYPKPATKATTKPKRRPLLDGFRDAHLDLDKIVGRWERLVADDRFPRNKNEATPYRNDLVRSIEALQRLADQMS